MTILITWKRAIAAMVALALAGLLFAWSGLFNVAASSGHWPVTTWAIHWVMQKSVQTHAWWEAPDRAIDRRGLVSAAGHYAQSCAICHGAPGQPPSAVMQQAEPPAPTLLKGLERWRDRELFWILNHGVKFTGMPAWAARDRPDEIARMVAFLRALPGMTPDEYRTLSGTEKGLGCASCHGTDGRGRGQGDIPVLGGQDAAYLEKALKDYASGRRGSAAMTTAARGLSPEMRRTMAELFADQPGVGAVQHPVGGDAAAAVIVTRGLPRRQLPACASCHAPGRTAPVLAGQKASYIAQRLRQWRGEEGAVDARQPQDAMAVIARRIPEDQIDALAAYLQGRPFARVSAAPLDRPATPAR